MHENWACTRRSPEIKGVATHRSFPWFHTLPDWVWYFSNVMGKPRIHGCLFCSLSYEIIGFSFWLLSKYVINHFRIPRMTTLPLSPATQQQDLYLSFEWPLMWAKWQSRVSQCLHEQRFHSRERIRENWIITQPSRMELPYHPEP